MCRESKDFGTPHFLFKLIAPLIGAVMESPLRRRFNDPVKTLKAAGVQPGQEVLEVGCGTGFFTISAAELVGNAGQIHAIDIYPPAIERVAKKVQDAGATNVRLARANALETGLPSCSFDVILLLGVIPSPTLPLDRLLPEMHRLLKPDGTLAVWTAFPWWSPPPLLRDGLFAYERKEEKVYRLRKGTSG
jgi:ubiquinone/menaquinone biosynthesis C-methylase UbiE